MNQIDLERAQREEARWRILRVLDIGRPRGLAESVIWRTLNDIELPITPQGVRRELHYLRGRGLVTISGEDAETLIAALTREGIDVVEYTVACQSGIARPPKGS
jgi:hypothetical protein